MHNLRIKQLLLYYISGVVLLTVTMGLGVDLLLNRVMAHSEYEHQITDQIVSSLAETKFHTVQIQQYLTDSSATGENDSVEDALKARNAALKAIDTMVKLDASLNQNASRLKSDLSALFDTGFMLSFFQSGAEPEESRRLV